MFDRSRCSATATLALVFADGYNGREPDGTYIDNSTEAFRAINCLDYTRQSDVDVMREEAAEIAAAAPVFGPYFGYGDLGCVQLAVPERLASGPRSTPTGAAPIIGRRHHERPGDARTSGRSRSPTSSRAACS